MSLPLRITVEGQDYSYTILTRMIDKETKEIKISLNEEVLTLLRNQNGDWVAIEQTISDEAGLIKAIVRNVVLRYRL